MTEPHEITEIIEMLETAVEELEYEANTDYAAEEHFPDMLRRAVEHIKKGLDELHIARAII